MQETRYKLYISEPNGEVTVPTYAYQCQSCGVRYERKEGFDAPVEHACPTCGATARRVLVPPVILFKGSGFYATDHGRGRRAAPGDGAKEERPAAPDEGTKADATSITEKASSPPSSQDGSSPD